MFDLLRILLSFLLLKYLAYVFSLSSPFPEPINFLLHFVHKPHFFLNAPFHQLQINLGLIAKLLNLTHLSQPGHLIPNDDRLLFD